MYEYHVYKRDDGLGFVQKKKENKIKMMYQISEWKNKNIIKMCVHNSEQCLTV